jgi:hypothetical protein
LRVDAALVRLARRGERVAVLPRPVAAQGGAG